MPTPSSLPVGWGVDLTPTRPPRFFGTCTTSHTTSTRSGPPTCGSSQPDLFRDRRGSQPDLVSSAESNRPVVSNDRSTVLSHVR
jgi:hypothetical protein